MKTPLKTSLVDPPKCHFRKVKELLIKDSNTGVFLKTLVFFQKTHSREHLPAVTFDIKYFPFH